MADEHSMNVKNMIQPVCMARDASAVACCVCRPTLVYALAVRAKPVRERHRGLRNFCRTLQLYSVRLEVVL